MQRAEAASGEAELYPAPPLRFDRRQVRRVLVALSVVAVVLSFAAQLLVPNLMAPVRTVWLSVATLWLVVLAAAYRRRNVGSLVIWLVVLLSAAAAAWAQVSGGGSWATTWAIPAICTFANVALGIVVWVVRLEPLEHLGKALLVLVFGLVPGLFVALGWVTTVLPSVVCVGFSLVLLSLMVGLKRRELGEALHRRLHV
nr:DUF6320 domain-containing protein [Tessaracoccus sp. OS52]